MTEQEKPNWFARLKEILYGMGAHDMSRYAMRTRASMEHLFILITMGDLIGVPILPPYYSLRLLPYVVPNVATWKRRMLREKDVSDAMFCEVVGYCTYKETSCHCERLSNRT